MILDFVSFIVSSRIRGILVTDLPGSIEYLLHPGHDTICDHRISIGIDGTSSHENDEYRKQSESDNADELFLMSKTGEYGAKPTGTRYRLISALMPIPMRIK